MTTLSQAVEAMERALEAEAEVLRAGTLEHLAKVERAKRKAWAALQVARPDKSVQNLHRIQDLATRNTRLLLAAKDGVTAAQSLRTTLAKGPKPLSTYGADGRKSTVHIDRGNTANSRSF